MSDEDAEARELLARQVARVEAMPCEDLRALIPQPRIRGRTRRSWWRIGWDWGEDHTIVEEVTAPSGETYWVDIEAMWDAEEGEAIRVFVCVYGGPVPPTEPLAYGVLVPRPGAVD